MGFVDNVARSVFTFLAKRYDLSGLIRNLERGGMTITQRCTAASDNKQNQDQLAHIIGIERWGQSRLRVLQGEALKMDESDGYYPKKGLSLAELGKVFTDTRTQTVDIARELQKANVPLHKTVRHNQFGDFQFRTWLQYLHTHSSLESKRLK